MAEEGGLPTCRLSLVDEGSEQRRMTNEGWRKFRLS